MADEQGSSTSEARVDRIKELNDRIIDSARKAGDKSVETYERSLENLAHAVESAGDRGVDWINAFSRSQVSFLRRVADEFPDALERISGEIRDLFDRVKTKARDVSGVGSKSSEKDTGGSAT